MNWACKLLIFQLLKIGSRLINYWFTRFNDLIRIVVVIGVCKALNQDEGKPLCLIIAGPTT